MTYHWMLNDWHCDGCDEKTKEKALHVEIKCASNNQDVDLKCRMIMVPGGDSSVQGIRGIQRYF
jgi:hypothetical protein